MDENDIARMMGRGAYRTAKFLGKTGWAGGKIVGKKAFDILTDKKGKERMAKEQHEQYIREKNAYRDSIAPKNVPFAFATITIAPDDKVLVGLDNVQLKYQQAFIFVNRQNHQIVFPESRFGRQTAYYLVDIRFDKNEYEAGHSVEVGHFDSRTTSYMHGKSTFSGSGGGMTTPFFNGASTSFGFGGTGNSYYRGVSRTQGNSYKEGRSISEKHERLTNALMTFVQVDNLDNTFTIEAEKVNSTVINGYYHYFMLSDIEKKRLGLI